VSDPWPLKGWRLRWPLGSESDIHSSWEDGSWFSGEVRSQVGRQSSGQSSGQAVGNHL
jgi:hypothetical protein